MNLKKNHNIYVSLLIILLSLIWSLILFLIYFVNTNSYFKAKMNDLINSIYQDVLYNIEFYAPKILFALIILLIGLWISVLTYKFIFYLFKKFNIVELIDKLTLEFSDTEEEKLKKNLNSNRDAIDSFSPIKLSQKIKIDKIVAKASAYYVFLLFFRLAIYKLNITDVEKFLTQLISYLPNLFIWFMIWFFWVRFADFIYDIIYHTLELSWQKTSKALASWWKMVVLFFTIITVLDKVWITTDITNTILIWFIAMLTIAWWIAFWLWWKDVAKEVLDSLKNK